MPMGLGQMLRFEKPSNCQIIGFLYMDRDFVTMRISTEAESDLELDLLLVHYAREYRCFLKTDLLIRLLALIIGSSFFGLLFCGNCFHV